MYNPPMLKELREDVLESVSIAIPSKKGNELLCVRKSSNGKLTFPGGQIDSPETPIQAAAREVREECNGMNIRVLGLIGIYEFQRRIDLHWMRRFVYAAMPTEGIRIPKAKKENEIIEVMYLSIKQILKGLDDESFCRIQLHREILEDLSYGFVPIKDLKKNHLAPRIIQSH
jgi:ADP-ribose pyrophosphatase YjhB (NUDIX family)